MDTTIVSAIIAVVGVFITALLTFYLWLQDNKQRRAKEQQVSTALYINPFIDACEQLQSRLYNVFEKNGLVALSAHYQNDKHAFEMLFQLSRYFGWERIVRRYASHAMNQEAIDLLEDLRETFSRTVGGEWRFYREEQKTLGQFAVRRVADTEREFEEVPFHTFESELKSGPLANMVSAQTAINSICNAGVDAEIINGRERLKKAQSFLVEILNKMETKVNYSVFRGTREKL